MSLGAASWDARAGRPMTTRPITAFPRRLREPFGPPEHFNIEDPTMRILLCCATCLAIATIASAQAIRSAAPYVDGYRQLAGSLERCQDALSRISGLEKDLRECGPSAAPDAVRRIIHDLAGQISVLASESARMRSALGPGREALRRAVDVMGEKMARCDSAAAAAIEDVIKQQQLSLSRRYASAADAMSLLAGEWDTIAKRLDQCAAFLAQSGAVALEWEKVTDLLPAAEDDETTQAISQAKSIARAVAARFDLLQKLKKGLPRLKAALSVLGYTVDTAPDPQTSGPNAPRPARTVTLNPGATQGDSPLPARPRALPAIRASSTVEELRRTGWLTVGSDSGRTPSLAVAARRSPGPLVSASPTFEAEVRNLLSWDREYYAPNIGIHFRLVPVGGASGAQLTRYPTPRSGAAQLLLEPGDTIYNLDALPIRQAVDVMNHHGRTDVSLINVRTGRPQTGVMILPGYTPLPPDVPPELYAGNLGIHYQLIPNADGVLGARLTRTAFGNTPAAMLHLELGDMIVRLDGEPIRRPEDVLAHFDQTKVDLIDIRTGRPNTAFVQLPGRLAR